MKNIMVTALLSATMLVSAQQLENVEVLDSVFLDTKTLQSRINSGKVIAKISSETLEQSTGKSVAQLLSEVAGVEINGSQSYSGQNLGYFVRGGRNRQVVIMIDGVQVNDPSSIANDYDLRLMSAQDLSQIEILKGASSVLYGSGAATAVINITTKKPQDQPIAATFSAALGTNQSTSDSNYKVASFTHGVNINGNLGVFNYLANFNHQYTDGLSAIAAPENESAFESDFFNRYNARFQVGANLNKQLSLSRFLSLDHFKTQYDNFDFTDANHLATSDQWRTGGNFEWKYSKGKFVFNDAYTEIKRSFNDNFPVKYDARNWTFDTYVHHQLFDNLSAVLGINVLTSNMNSYSIPFGESQFAQIFNKDEARFTLVDPYLNLVYNSGGGFNLSAGARLHTHSVYDSKWVYQLNPSYRFDLGANKLKLLASYSTAYITPSLFQIYHPNFGNENLKPEENTTLEAGVVFIGKNNLMVSAVYFSRNEKNFVDFVTVDPDFFISQYINIEDEFDAHGVEVEVSKRWNSKWRTTANYTYTNVDERFALRIPEHKANANIYYSPNAKTNFSISYQYNTKRADRFFSPTTFMQEQVTLDAYGLLNAYTSFQVNDQLKVFAQLHNILNESYEELYRYSTLGRNVTLGFSLSF